MSNPTSGQTAEDAMSIGSELTALALSDSSEGNVGPFEDAESALLYDVSCSTGYLAMEARSFLIPLLVTFRIGFWHRRIQYHVSSGQYQHLKLEMLNE